MGQPVEAYSQTNVHKRIGPSDMTLWSLLTVVTLYIIGRVLLFSLRPWDFLYTGIATLCKLVDPYWEIALQSEIFDI